MAALLTVQEIQQYIETDLDPLSLQRYIDAADAEIVRAVGAHSSGGTVTETLIGGDRGLFPARPWASITSVTEYSGTTSTVLSANDYRAWYGNRALQRLSTGDNPAAYWSERVEVVYTPVDDDAERIQATIELVRLSVQNTGLQSERVGDYSATRVDTQKERAMILSRLNRKSHVAV